MFYIIVWALFWGLIGSFGTAYLHQRTGRDVQMGGLLGAAVGAVGGIFFLVMFWMWLYYNNSSGGVVGRVYGKSRREWYSWWM